MKLREKSALVIIMIVVAMLTRLIPHWPNFTALGAVALFGGAFLSKRLAYIIPLAALFLSDLLLNNLLYEPLLPGTGEGFVFFYVESLWIYAAFMLIVFVGMKLLSKRSIGRIAGSSLLASSLFFLVTNFGVWAGSVMYPKSLSGLILCFEAGIPFFWNTLAGDLFFVTILFGAYALVSERAQSLDKQSIQD